MDVRCGHCGTDNRDAARFCGACGDRLEHQCSRCGATLADGLKFCDQCGTPTADVEEPAPAAPDAARKLVTVAFVDLGGSTAFGEVVDAETARSVMGRYHSLVTEAVGTHRGTVAKYIGDGVMVFFGVPEVAEDDAVRAVAFGADVQERFAPFAERVLDRHGATVTLRVGINTGEIVIGRDDVDLYGDALNVAARLEKACPHGGVLVGEETWRLARGTFVFEAQGDVEVHGRVGAVRPYLLTDDTVVEERNTPFVGRADELDRLGVLFSQTVNTRRPGLASVIGPPGVGKTRLSRELQTLVEKAGAVVYTTACDRDGEATLGPIADLLRPDDVVDADSVRANLTELLAGDDDAGRVVEGLVAVLGLATKKVSVEETFWALRRLVERLGRETPIVVIVDDIQWASDQLLDLFEHLATYVVDTPLLLVTLARPEMRDLRPAFAEAGRLVDEVVLLTGLDAESTAALAVRLLGGDELPRGLAERLPASTDGNPLFVREVVHMLVDEEIVRRDGDRWVLTVEPDAIDVPSTVQSLLAARVERLPAEERVVLERAAVIGPDFTRAGLEHLCTETERSGLPQVLRSLTRKELIEATGSYWGDDPVHRFHHVLIRDAVYRRLLKETRAGLHERIGEWMERASTDVLGEHDAAIGHHFEQAFHYRIDLGDDDDAVAALGARAADRLADAARVALRGDDTMAAGALARRALACLAPATRTRPQTLTLACEALLDVGDVTAARPFIDELLALADLEPAFAGWAKAYDAQAITINEPDRLADAEILATAAVEALSMADDPAGEAKARLVRASILARRGRIGECEAELDVALTKAREAKDTRRVVAVLGVAPLAALWGPSPVARAGGRCLDVLRLLRITASSPAVEAAALRCQAVLEALRGRYETAFSLIDRARRSIAELGLRRELADIDMARGQIHLLSGDPAAAEGPLRTAHDELLAIGAGAEASQAAALLGRTLLRLDRIDEVEMLVDEAEHLAGENLKAAILGRTVRAEWLLASGRTDEARVVAERAVAIAETTDLVLDHAEACEVLDAAGEPTTTAAELRERKGVADPGDAPPFDDDTLVPKFPTPDGQAESISETGDGRATGTEAAIRASIERMTAAWRAGDRAAWEARFAEGAVVDVRRAVGANSTSGAAALEAMWSLREALPHNPTQIEALSDRGIGRGSVRFHDDAGNEVAMYVVLEFDSTLLVERLTTFDGDGDGGEGAEALFERRVVERGGDGFGLGAGRDPLDRYEFVVPELRRVVDGTPYATMLRNQVRGWTGRPSRRAVIHGGNDTALDDRRSIVGLGAARPPGSDGIRLLATDESTWVGAEVLAVRGSRLGVVRVTMSDGDGDVDMVLVVDEVDRAGRIIRSTQLAPDAVAEADALLDEWFWSSDEAVFERQMSAGRRMMDAQHDPSRRDDLLDVLSEDFTYRYPAVLGDRFFGRDEYIDLVRSFMNTDDHGVEDWQAWAVWGEPLSERVLLSVVRRRARMADGTTPEWLWVGVMEMGDGQIRRLELLAIEELEAARRLAHEWNGVGAFGELPAPLVGVPFVDSNHWNDAVRWRLRMIAWLNDRERDLSASFVHDDVTVHDRRPLFRTDLTTLDDVLRHGTEMVGIADELVDQGIIQHEPFRLVGVIDTAGERLSLTAEFVDGVGDMLQVVEVNEQDLLLRNATFEPEQIEEARATLAEWHTESTSPPSDDPLDRYEFVVPEFRRVIDGTPWAEMARMQRQIKEGQPELGPFLWGRDDVRLDDRRSVVNLGEHSGGAIADAYGDFHPLFPHIVSTEPLAVRGTRFGVGKIVFADDAGNEYAFLAVDEVDRDGRIIRSVHLDSDRIMEAVALLDEWYAGSDDAVGRMVGEVGAAVLATNHEPTRRDELLELLPDDVVIRFADELASWGEVSRDDYLTIADTLTAEADRIDYWCVWFEPLSETVSFGVVRRIAHMPDGTTPEWVFAIAAIVGDGRLRQIDLFPVEDIDRARAHARTLNGLGAYGQVPAPLADLPVVEAPDWNDAARVRLRFLCGGEEAVPAADHIVLADRRPLINGEMTGPEGRQTWLNAVRETVAPAIEAGTIPPDPGRMISVLAVSGDRHCLVHEAILGGAEWLTVYEIDDAGRELHLTFFEPEQVDDAFVEFRAAAADRIVYADPDVRRAADGTTFLRATAAWSRAYGAAAEDELAWIYGRDDVVVEGRRAIVNAGTTTGADALAMMLETRRVVPLRGHVEILAVRGDRFGATRITLRDRGGNEMQGIAVGEVDDDERVIRQVNLDDGAIDEAFAVLDRWHRESTAPADPLDRIGFAFPELRAVVEATPYAALADLVEAYASGDEGRLAWFFGRDDVVIENRLPTIDSGTNIGPAAAELVLVTRRRFPVPIGNEILAVRGPRHGSNRCSYRDADGNQYEFINVVEVDDDGRVIRQVNLDPDAIIEAVELLDEWYASSSGAIGRETMLAGSSILHSTCDPARRDELLSRLDDDVVFRMMSGSSLLDDLDRDAFLAVQNALVDQAERVAFWGVWNEPVTDDVIFAVLRRLAVMPDGSTAEWLVATANVYRDGCLLLCENFDIGDFEAARRRTTELAELHGDIDAALTGFARPSAAGDETPEGRP